LPDHSWRPGRAFIATQLLLMANKRDLGDAEDLKKFSDELGFPTCCKVSSTPGRVSD
jgi:hypothetical protein